MENSILIHIYSKVRNCAFASLVFLLIPLYSFGQSSQNDLVGMKLDAAEALLEERGYEIAGSSLFKKQQLWYNEKENNCLAIAFEKKGDHVVTEVKAGDEGKCISGIAAAHKVMDSYHDGPAPANSAAIEKERKKLTEKGFVVSYWIKDIAPGRSSEYWKNEASKDCKFIAWNTEGQDGVRSDSCDSKYRINPYPKEN